MKTFKPLIVAAPTREGAASLYDANETLQKAAHTVTLSYEDVSMAPLDHLVNLAGRERMLTQRMGPLESSLTVHIGRALASLIMKDEEWDEVIAVNLTASFHLTRAALRGMMRQRFGRIIGISSVACDRGRQSNYVDGAAKGALSLYLQGLRNRLFASGVRVITIKPGFVDTAMTYGLPGLFLVASPQDIGARIVRSLDKSADVVYLPWFWRYIMLIIRHIPEPVFKRLKL